MQYHKNWDVERKDLYHIFAAAVLSMLIILLDLVLLGIAIKIEYPSWAAGFLVLSVAALSLIGLLAVIAILSKFYLYFQNPTNPVLSENQEE
jgi:predicted ferric reductase